MVVEKNKCTGCFACYNICPKKAIKMEEDIYGFIYPIIDYDKCINCGQCKSICPSINKIKLNYPLKCYAMYAKDKKIRNTSSSGGVSTVLANHVLNSNGVVYGASFNNFESKHIRISKKEDINKIQGSKYIHSYILDTYKSVKKDLKDKIVLFTGTPCQIAGLKNYLKIEYENLYLVDIICHGVPSIKFLKEDIGIDIDNISFRVNNYYFINLIKKNKIISTIEMDNSFYLTGFMSGLFCRDNCYNCLYANSYRVSDITIGDFWGLESNSKLYKDRDHGVSVILPITKKGLKLINSCKKDMILEERSIEEAINGNSQLNKPIEITKKHNKFMKLYKKYGFKKAYYKTEKIRFIKKRLKNNKLIYFIYKKVVR